MTGPGVGIPLGPFLFDSVTRPARPLDGDAARNLSRLHCDYRRNCVGQRRECAVSDGLVGGMLRFRVRPPSSSPPSFFLPQPKQTRAAGYVLKGKLRPFAR